MFRPEATYARLVDESPPPDGAWLLLRRPLLLGLVLAAFISFTTSGRLTLLEAVRQGRTLVFDADGAPVGDLELIRLLRASSFEPDLRKLYGESRSAVDLVTRACAWLGLVGLVVLGRGQEGADPHRRTSNTL